MRRIIVHLIRGKAKDAHEAITRNLVEALDAFPIHDRIVPHLTIKRWFELDDQGLTQLYSVLDTFAATHAQSNYRLHDFNNFGEGVIYVDVDASAEMLAGAKDLMKALRHIQGMTFDEYDEIEGDFHATVAMRALKPFDFNDTWNYLQTLDKMDFSLKFDNVAVLKREHVAQPPKMRRLL